MGGIHPTAIVDGGARLGADVTVGPYSVVGGGVTLGDGVALGAHVFVGGRTTIGPRTTVGVFSVIGGEPQDLSYRGEDTAVEVGADCSIREHVTVHRGTAGGRGVTRIGDHCFLMIASHVAHDCTLGRHVILTNQATLGGHVEVGDYTILGGLSAVQQRCRIGAHCFVGGLTGVQSDTVPFVMALGNRAALGGINVRGLKRRGFDRTAIHALRAAYRMFFFTPGARAARIATIVESYPDVPAVMVLVDFLRATGDRPLVLPRERDDEGDDDET
jgi:UDP-N-acetylglucosamine acyltransferase